MHRNDDSLAHSRRDPSATVPNVAPSRQWLVSVRDIDEAKCAADFGVDILDLKEPDGGSLAPTSAETWQEVSDWAGSCRADRRRPFRLSAALGESDQAAGLAPYVPADFDFAKAGPSECNCESQLFGLWDTLRAALPNSVELVAVAYADHTTARSLPALSIISLAARAGFKRILLDTFDKSQQSAIDGQQSAIDGMGTSQLAEFGRLTRQHRLWWSLAGSIKLEHLVELEGLFPDIRFSPDCVAVRGDVCDHSRTGMLCRDRLAAWSSVMHRSG